MKKIKEENPNFPEVILVDYPYLNNHEFFYSSSYKAVSEYKKFIEKNNFYRKFNLEKNGKKIIVLFIDLSFYIQSRLYNSDGLIPESILSEEIEILLNDVASYHLGFSKTKSIISLDKERGIYLLTLDSIRWERNVYLREDYILEDFLQKEKEENNKEYYSVIKKYEIEDNIVEDILNNLEILLDNKYHPDFNKIKFDIENHLFVSPSKTILKRFLDIFYKKYGMKIPMIDITKNHLDEIFDKKIPFGSLLPGNITFIINDDTEKVESTYLYKLKYPIIFNYFTFKENKENCQTCPKSVNEYDIFSAWKIEYISLSIIKEYLKKQILSQN